MIRFAQYIAGWIFSVALAVALSLAMGGAIGPIRGPVPHMLGAVAPSSPVAWAVPSWYIDGSNVTGCASDANTGTSATCGAAGSGVGPVATATQIVSRYGTNSTIFATDVVWTTLSPSLATDRVVFSPILRNGAKFRLWGTYTHVASGTLSNIVSKVYGGPGQLLTVTLAAPPPANAFVRNLTHPSRAVVNNCAGAVCTMAQPLFTTDFATTYAATIATPVDTWANGDSYVVEVPPSVGYTAIVATATGLFAPGSDLLTGVYVEAVTGPELGTRFITYGGNTSIVNSTFAYGVVAESTGKLLADIGTRMVDVQASSMFFTAEATIGGNQESVFGGAYTTLTIGGGGQVGLDAIVGLLLVKNSSIIQVASTYLSSGLVLRGGQGARCHVFSKLWGPGSISIGYANELDIQSPASWVSNILLSGGIINAEGLGMCSFASSVYTCGRALTLANLDLYGGLSLPLYSLVIATTY